ncbi:MAG: DUF2851 family protein [Rikenellaceae bacterium]
MNGEGKDGEDIIKSGEAIRVMVSPLFFMALLTQNDKEMRWFDDMDYMHPKPTGEVTESMSNLLRRGAKEYRCGEYLHALDPISYTKILEELESERLERKAKEVTDLVSHRRMNWNKVMLMQLLRSLSDRLNKMNYIELGFMINDTTLEHERESLFNLETLLIYPSGLLDKLPNDDYVESVRQNGERLYRRYNLELMSPIRWSAVSPSIHPLLRLSQVAHLYHRNELLFNTIINCRNRVDVLNLFKDIYSSEEWCRYFNLKQTSVGVIKSDLVAINLVVTMLYSYGYYFNNDEMISSAIALLESLPAESNGYINNWRKKGLLPHNAFDTQALIQLSDEYCLRGRCNHCPVARHICSESSILGQLPHFFDTKV